MSQRIMISPVLDRNAVLEFGARTIINVSDLIAASRALFERELFGPARSVAITALEELGKFVLALDQLAGTLTTHEFLKRVRKHHPKQRWGYAITFLAPWLVEVVQRELGPCWDPVVLSERFEQRLRKDGRIVQELERRTPEITALLEYLASGQVERDRQDGWYVSLNAENGTYGLVHPRLVRREEAQTVLTLFSAFDQEGIDVMALLGISKGEHEALPEENMIEALKKMLDTWAKQIPNRQAT